MVNAFRTIAYSPFSAFLRSVGRHKAAEPQHLTLHGAEPGPCYIGPKTKGCHADMALQTTERVRMSSVHTRLLNS